MVMVVANLFKLARLDGVFDKEQKKLERAACVITRDYFEQINSESHSNGLMYEEDVKATEKYYADSAIENQRKAEAEELKDSAGKLLTEAIGSINKEAKNKLSAKKKSKDAEAGEAE